MWYKKQVRGQNQCQSLAVIEVTCREESEWAQHRIKIESLEQGKKKFSLSPLPDFLRWLLKVLNVNLWMYKLSPHFSSLVTGCLFKKKKKGKCGQSTTCHAITQKTAQIHSSDTHLTLFSLFLFNKLSFLPLFFPSFSSSYYSPFFFSCAQWSYFKLFLTVQLF